MKKIDIKLGQYFKEFYEKIKPKSSKNYSKRNIWIIWDILLGLTKGQECFLNAIVQNMKHYKSNLDDFKNWKTTKILSKVSQIAKISEYLNIDLTKFKHKFLKYTFSKIEIKSFNELKSKSIKQRVFEQPLLLYDTTDIQKPFAKKMEKVAQARDWSTRKSWKWYYAEWTILFLKWKIIPLLLTLFSSKETSDAKIISRKNIDFIKNRICIKNVINVFDRGYDVASFMKTMVEKKELFIIRWIKTRWVVCPEYYERIKWKWTTKLDRQTIFSSVKDFAKEMNFKQIETHKHYQIAFKKVLKKWENADSDINDVFPVNLVIIRLVKDSNIKWIEEDLQTFKNAWEDFEKEFYFYTNLEIETTTDALVVFYLYLKRWKIETWFRYLKQVFWLEKLKILWYKKLKNMCNLLVFSSYYLYDTFYNVLNKYDNLSEKSLENIINQEEIEKQSKENNFNIFLLKYYYQYCKQKNLEFNPDSFTKFICDEVWSEVIYCENIVLRSW